MNTHENPQHFCFSCCLCIIATIPTITHPFSNSNSVACHFTKLYELSIVAEIHRARMCFDSKVRSAISLSDDVAAHSRRLSSKQLV